MLSCYLVPALALLAGIPQAQAAEVGGLDGPRRVDGTRFTFRSGTNGEGSVVGTKPNQAWDPSATNNTCIAKGAEGLQSVVASSPVLDYREDRTYCILGYREDNCIGRIIWKEYQAPFVRLLYEDGPPTWSYNFETDISSAQVVRGPCLPWDSSQSGTSVAETQSSANPQSANFQEPSSTQSTDSQDPSSTPIPESSSASSTEPADEQETVNSQIPEPTQSSSAKAVVPLMRPVLLYMMILPCRWL